MANLESIRSELLDAGRAVEKALGHVDALKTEYARLFKAQRDHDKQVEVLRRDREKFDREARWLEQLDFESQQEIVKFRVGGSLIETTRKTLTASRSSMLAAWFSGRHPLRKNENGEIFLDRDPAVFSCLLDYLRCGCSRRWDIPPNIQEGRLCEEFDFFCVPLPFSEQLPGILQRENSDWDMTVLDSEGSHAAVLCVAADEKFIVSGGIDQAVKVWDMRNFEEKWTSPPRHSGPVCCVVINGNFVAAGFSNGDVVVFDAESGREEGKFFQEENRVNTVAIDGRALAVGMAGIIYVWDLQTKGQICKFRGYDDIDRFGFFDQMLVFTRDDVLCLVSLGGDVITEISIGSPQVLAHRVFPMPDCGLIMVAYEDYQTSEQDIYYGFFNPATGKRVSVIRGESIISYPVSKNCVIAVDVSRDSALVIYECTATNGGGSGAAGEGGSDGVPVERSREIRFKLPLNTAVADVCVVGERIVCACEDGKVVVVKPR